MKPLLLSLILLLGSQQVSAQKDLDSLITSLAKTNQLYNRKLKKLESTRLNVIKSNASKNEWIESYKAWIGHSVDSLDVQVLLTDYFNLKTRDANNLRTGYSLDYLTYRIDNCINQNQLSKKNGIVLRNILMGELDEGLLKNEIKKIESAIRLFATEKKVSTTSIVEFINRHSKLDSSSDAYSIFNIIKGYTAEDRDAFAEYMINLGIRMEGLPKSLPIPSKASLSICSMSFASLLYNPGAITLLKEDDFFKYQVFFENSTIKNFFFSAMLFAEWKSHELADLDKRNFAVQMEKDQKEPPSRLFISLESGFNYALKKFGLGDTSQCFFDQLLVLAYNDIYFNLRRPASVKFNRVEKKIDFSIFNLTDTERTIINGILSTQEVITEYHLKTSITNEFLSSANWNVEFKLACYIALYYKSLNQSRDWNKERYILNPFEKGEKLYRYGWKVEQIKWESLKEKCKSELSKHHHNSDRLVIAFNGQNVTFISPISGHSRDRIVELAVRHHIQWAVDPYYYRMILDVEKNSTSPVPIAINSNNVYIETLPPEPEINQKYVPAQRLEIIDFPDVEASFPGGKIAMKNWIKENLEYPEISRELGDQGIVYILFVVETDGSLAKVDLYRKGVTPALNKEAMRLIKSMPKWIPGEIKGKKVITRCRVPIRFVLAEH